MTRKRVNYLVWTWVALMLLVSSAAAQDTTRAASLLTKGKYIPDIATFLQIGGCSPAGYSWDGKDVYFTSSMSGETQVYRINVQGWPYQLTTFEDGIDFFVLSYGGTMAIAVSYTHLRAHET